jgi:hypothetical protein
MKARNAAPATLALAGGYLGDAQADIGCAGLVRWAGDARAASDDGSGTPMGNRATGPMVD